VTDQTDQALAAGGREIQVRALDHGLAQQAGNPAQRRIGGQAQDQEHHQRTQVAVAQPHERSVAADPDQGHAKAEEQPAEDRAQPAEIRRQIDRFVQIDPTRRVGGLGQHQRHGDGQEPAAQLHLVAAVIGIGDCAESAELSPTRRRAEGDTDQKAQRRHQGRGFEFRHVVSLRAPGSGPAAGIHHTAVRPVMDLFHVKFQPSVPTASGAAPSGPSSVSGCSTSTVETVLAMRKASAKEICSSSGIGARRIIRNSVNAVIIR